MIIKLYFWFKFVDAFLLTGLLRFFVGRMFRRRSTILQVTDDYLACTWTLLPHRLPFAWAAFEGSWSQSWCLFGRLNRHIVTDRCHRVLDWIDALFLLAIQLIVIEYMQVHPNFVICKFLRLVIRSLFFIRDTKIIISVLDLFSVTLFFDLWVFFGLAPVVWHFRLGCWSTISFHCHSRKAIVDSFDQQKTCSLCLNLMKLQ